jgi:hypothetical protein
MKKNTTTTWENNQKARDTLGYKNNPENISNHAEHIMQQNINTVPHADDDEDTDYSDMPGLADRNYEDKWFLIESLPFSGYRRTTSFFPLLRPITYVDNQNLPVYHGPIVFEPYSAQAFTGTGYEGDLVIVAPEDFQPFHGIRGTHESRLNNAR